MTLASTICYIRHNTYLSIIKLIYCWWYYLWACRKWLHQWADGWWPYHEGYSSDDEFSNLEDIDEEDYEGRLYSHKQQFQSISNIY